MALILLACLKFWAVPETERITAEFFKQKSTDYYTHAIDISQIIHHVKKNQQTSILVPRLAKFSDINYF